MMAKTTRRGTEQVLIVNKPPHQLVFSVVRCEKDDDAGHLKGDCWWQAADKDGEIVALSGKTFREWQDAKWAAINFAVHVKASSLMIGTA